MSDSFYLAWRYLRYHRWTTAILVASMTLILFLPAGLQVIVANAERHFRARAETTPLLVGPRGSSLQLVLASVYFDKPFEQTMRYEQLERIEGQGLGTAIPLHTRFVARDCQVVGTSLDYVQARSLNVSEGYLWSMLGECVIGAGAAERLDVELGDKIPVSTTGAFVLDNPPLRLRVVGILAANETPDDEVILVSLETAWVIEGLGHGHAPEAEHGSPEAGLYTDITAENISSFHFHGDRNQFPITAILVTPVDDRAETILRGQYFSADETVQIVRPRDVMNNLLQRVVMVRSHLVAVIAIVSLVTLLLISLVIGLSIRLRRAEIVTMSKMGCSRYRIASILSFQIGIILSTSVIISALLTGLTNEFGTELVRWFIL